MTYLRTTSNFFSRIYREKEFNVIILCILLDTYKCKVVSERISRFKEENTRHLSDMYICIYTRCNTYEYISEVHGFMD